VLELDPTCREAHLGLLSLWRERGTTSEVLDSYERLAHHMPCASSSRFRCRACGHAADEPFWRCPACHVWATPERLMPQPNVVPVTSRACSSPRSQLHGDTSATTAVMRDTSVQAHWE
jgi:lipopolysaccharide biosynthesis regulator YciM